MYLKKAHFLPYFNPYILLSSFVLLLSSLPLSFPFPSLHLSPSFPIHLFFSIPFPSPPPIVSFSIPLMSYPYRSFFSLLCLPTPRLSSPFLLCLHSILWFGSISFYSNSSNSLWFDLILVAISLILGFDFALFYLIRVCSRVGAARL